MAGAWLGGWKRAETIPLTEPTGLEAATEPSFAGSRAAGAVDCGAHLHVVLGWEGYWHWLAMKRARSGVE